MYIAKFMTNSMNRTDKKISVVVPVYNEEEAVVQLHNEIIKVMQSLRVPYEIIFVDDGSTDGTFDVLEKLSPITIIRFRRNFGQTAALDAGIKNASGYYVITMDGDGQNDPADIPQMVKTLESKNLDVVSGWRKKRHDPLLKKLASRAAALVRKILINDGIHDSGCTLKVYKRECFEHVDLVGEMHRFIPALLRIKGFSVGEFVVNHRQRKTGKTKYNWTRGVRGILDMISVWFWKKYANRPLHLFGGIGVILIIVSFVAGGIAVYQKIALGQDLSDTALTILALFSFLAGIQLFVFGLIGDIVSKNYYASTRDAVYDIREIVEKNENPRS